MDWNVVAQYLPLFEKAAWLTLRLGLAGIALAIVIGLVCALVQYYKVPVLRRIVGFYIQLSRNTPLLVQLFSSIMVCRRSASGLTLRSAALQVWRFW